MNLLSFVYLLNLILKNFLLNLILKNFLLNFILKKGRKVTLPEGVSRVAAENLPAAV